MKKKSNIMQYILFFIILIIMPLNNALSNLNENFSFIDEIFVALGIIIFILCLCINKLKLSLYKYEIKIIILSILLATLGLVSSYYFKYQPYKQAMNELMLFFKFIIAYICIRQILKGFNIYEIKNIILKICNILTISMFILLVGDITFNIFSTVGYRFGIRASNLIFSHPTYLAGFSMIMLCFYTLFYQTNKVKINTYIIMNLLLMASTLRNKALIFILVYVFLFYIYKNIKINRLIRTVFIVLAVLGIIILFKDSISERLLYEDTARNILYSKSIEIANEHFPLGAGLGTFASDVSGKYYSILYYKYGINNVYGLTSNNYRYVSDTFWPMVIAQFGFIGIAIFLIIIYYFIQLIRNIKDKDLRFTCSIIIIYILISSTSEAIFNSYIGVTLFSILAIFINNNILLEEKNEEKSIDSKCSSYK